jgi:hypothetical protein
MRDHYTIGKLDALAIIEDWNLDFVSGNIVKYVQRYQHKGQSGQDQLKILWYAAYLVTRSREFADRVTTDAREVNNGRSISGDTCEHTEKIR